MRGRSGLVAAALAVIGIAILVSMVVPRKRTQKPPERRLLTTEITRLDEPVTYCVDKHVELPHGRVQILVDASGSMKGVHGAVINYVRWLEHGISRLRDSALAIDEIRIAAFERAHGIVPASSIRDFGAAYQPQSETNLHDAIRASKDWDLTFIITDGVAAAGAGSGDCAAGVDAACVARALREAVYVERTSAVELQTPGIWIVPLWTRHTGIFYSERPMSVAEFDRDASLATIHQELEQDVSITRPRSDRAGNLVFDYTGPRALMLVVIAHSAALGRAAVVALRERMSENNVIPVQTTRSSSTVGAFAALELYPGYLPRAEWTSLIEDDDSIPKGTMDVDFVERRRIALQCEAQTTNETAYILESKWKRAGGRCVAIYQLPAFELGFIAGTDGKDADLGSFIGNVERESRADGEKFKLALLCGQQPERPCGSKPVRAQWVARPRYDQTGHDEDSGSSAMVGTLSTVNLTKQPHRLYAFDSLLSYFFDEVSTDQRQFVIADIEICHRSGHP